MTIASENRMQLCRSLSGGSVRGSVVCAKPLKYIRLFRFHGLICSELKRTKVWQIVSILILPQKFGEIKILWAGRVLIL